MTYKDEWHCKAPCGAILETRDDARAHKTANPTHEFTHHHFEPGAPGDPNLEE